MSKVSGCRSVWRRVFLWSIPILLCSISCSRENTCPAYKDDGYLVKNVVKHKKKKKSYGLFETKVATAYGLHKYDKHISDRKAKRLLKKTSKSKEE